MLRLLLSICLLAGIFSCTITSRPSQNTETGKPSSFAEIQTALNQQGKVSFEKIVAADWAISRAGLINLDDPKAKALGIKDGDEEIQFYFYVFDHPDYGRYLIDTGVEEALQSNPSASAVGSLIRRVMKVDEMMVHRSTAAWYGDDKQDIRAIFLTHMHIDHILGLPDLPESVPVYVGHGETTQKSLQNIFVRGATDRLLGESRLIYELMFGADEAGENHGLKVLDFFGDQSLFLISVPGHTQGSLAFVVNAKDGAHLIVGDTCHTRWGWENNVVPGNFTENHQLNAKNLTALRDLASRHPQMQVHLGHQSTTGRDKLELLPTKI